MVVATWTSSGSCEEVMAAASMAQPGNARLVAFCDAGGLPVAYPGAAKPAV